MSAVTTFLRGAALGAAAMYLLDPDRGRRRRAIARDKLRRGATQASAFVDAARRDARHRIQALRARATRLRASEQEVGDLVLIERVRARVGRVVQHPHALRVGALRGRVQLSGPLLADEHARLLAAVRRVPGVREIDDSYLALYESAEHISALQGGRDARGAGNRHWTPAMRLAVLGGGGMLALRGVTQGGLARLAFSIAGAALMTRAATNRPLDALFDASTAGERMRAAHRASEDTNDDWTASPAPARPAAQPGL
ncbi:MAG TPA: hypothetical protein VLR71_18680 [Casimicrobiaceae bacterium]|nr:hypothetical protein [Casimicrobiaceae bacterium]